MIIKVKNAEAFKTSSRNAGRVCRPFVVFAVLCAVLLLSAGCLRDIEPMKEAEMTESSTPTVMPIPTAANDEERIVYGEPFFEEDLLDRGEFKIYGALEKDIFDPEYDQALFCVRIDLEKVAGDMLQKTMKEFELEYNRLSTSEENDYFMSMYTSWWYDVKVGSMTEEERELCRKLNNSTYPDIVFNEQYYNEFFDYLEQNVSAEKAEEQREFRKRIDTAAYYMVNSETPEVVMERYRVEVERLIDLGYRVDRDTLTVIDPGFEGYVKAYLTGSQIKDFEAYPEYAYRICYAGPESDKIPAPTDPASQGEPTEVSSESAPTATPDPLAAIEGRNIVYGPALPDEDIVYNGEVMIYNPLRDDTLDPAYADSLFYVTIDFRNLAVDTVRKTFGAIEAEYREITSSTIWETDELHNGFSYWWYYIKEPSLSERERELYERRMSKDFGGFDYNVPYYTEYCDYVEERISFNRAEKLREYIRKVARASTDYFCYETPAEAVEEHIAEINRLIECGYAVDINTLVIPWPGYNGRVNAYLSGDQLQSFEAYPEYAYKIYYARHE